MTARATPLFNWRAAVTVGGLCLVSGLLMLHILRQMGLYENRTALVVGMAISLFIGCFLPLAPGPLNRFVNANFEESEAMDD